MEEIRNNSTIPNYTNHVLEMNKGWWSNRGYTRMLKKLSVLKIDYQKQLIDKELQENNVVNHKKTHKIVVMLIVNKEHLDKFLTIINRYKDFHWSWNLR